MKELIEKMNLHTINVEGDYIISEEQLEAFAKIYLKEQLRIGGVSNRRELFSQCGNCGHTKNDIGKCTNMNCNVYG